MAEVASAGGFKSPTRVVVGSSNWSDADCDYLCDGVNDEIQIQQAIDAVELSYATRREILFLPGTYNLSYSPDGCLKTAIGSIKFCGLDPKSTILNMTTVAPGASSFAGSAPMFICVSELESDTGTVFENLTINAYGTASGLDAPSCIYYEDNSDAGSGNSLTVVNCIMRGRYGIIASCSSDNGTKVTIRDCTIEDYDSTVFCVRGITVTNGCPQIVNNRIYGYRGAMVKGCNGVISGNYFDGIQIIGLAATLETGIIQGNIFMVNDGPEQIDGISMGYCKNVIVTNNLMPQTGTTSYLVGISGPETNYGCLLYGNIMPGVNPGGAELTIFDDLNPAPSAHEFT